MAIQSLRKRKKPLDLSGRIQEQAKKDRAQAEDLQKRTGRISEATGAGQSQVIATPEELENIRKQEEEMSRIISFCSKIFLLAWKFPQNSDALLEMERFFHCQLVKPYNDFSVNVNDRNSLLP